MVRCIGWDQTFDLSLCRSTANQPDSIVCTCTFLAPEHWLCGVGPIFQVGGECEGSIIQPSCTFIYYVIMGPFVYFIFSYDP